MPEDDTAAVAWAVISKPTSWELGEWLSRLMPDGIWSDMDPSDLADQMVGAATRARTEEPPE